MPNWVDNEIKINADEEFLQGFADRHIVDGKFDFSTIIPVDISDDEYHGTEVRKFANGEEYLVGGKWYDWNVANWGTKWNACEPITDNLISNGYLWFLTAWSPPIPVVEALVKMYPNLTIEWYFREEQGWGGNRLYEDGVERITMRKSWDIPSNHAENIEVFDYCWACDDEEEMEGYGCPV
jgi:hypothetical protein